ncbi:MAG: insulinase family protein [Oscillospiraceae bacterium]|nr:insulinase family protein [Oscillospiraceae bacterium]
MKENCYPNFNQKMISHTCSNGLKICVFPKPGFRRSYAMLAVNYGSIDISFQTGEGIYTSPLGVAHFLEHKVFEQPDGGNALSVFAKTGASPNAFTSKTMTAYHFSGTEKFMHNLEILLDFVTTPYFTDENVAKEQGIIGQEISMVNDRPVWRVYENLMSALYSVHPAKDSIIGTVDSIGRITRDVLFKCYNTFYVPSNMTLCVAGDVSAERIISAAESMLSRDRVVLPVRDYGYEPPAVARKYVEQKMETPIPMFGVGAKCAVKTSGEDGMRNRIIADLAADVLGGPSSPLYASLYGKGVISADFDSEAIIFPGSIAMMLSGESRDPKRVLDEVCKSTESLAGGVEAGYFSRIKKAYLGTKLRSLDKVRGLCHEQAEAVFGGYDYLDTIEVINEIEASEISAFIAKMFKEESVALSVVHGK